MNLSQKLNASFFGNAKVSQFDEPQKLIAFFFTNFYSEWRIKGKKKQKTPHLHYDLAIIRRARRGKIFEFNYIERK